MSNPIEFYFDFTSPFGYLASRRIEGIAQQFGRTVQWHPIVLGFIFKVTEGRPLVDLPIKGDYAKMDMQRTAREYKIDYQMPSVFPIATVAASRAVLWLQSQEKSTDNAQSTKLIHALYSAYFVDDKDISQPEQVVATAAATGIDADELSAALQDADVKALLKQAVDAALEKKVFGSPFMIVDDEPFWGSDRLEQLQRWLETGGW